MGKRDNAQEVRGRMLQARTAPVSTTSETRRPSYRSGVRRTGRMTAAGIAAIALLAAPVHAQEGLPLLRDTETEALLRDYARPIFRAAGLGGQNISMRLIRHESFNAFVADGQNVFV
ncbi:MAG: hypothetical protein RL291_1680, partial [Pseudomonadota bacterium]